MSVARDRSQAFGFSRTMELWHDRKGIPSTPIEMRGSPRKKRNTKTITSSPSAIRCEYRIIMQDNNGIRWHFPKTESVSFELLSKLVLRRPYRTQTRGRSAAISPPLSCLKLHLATFIFVSLAIVFPISYCRWHKPLSVPPMRS